MQSIAPAAWQSGFGAWGGAHTWAGRGLLVLTYLVTSGAIPAAGRSGHSA